MNQKKKRKIFILGFFALVWISLIFYGYERYKVLQGKSEQIFAFNEQFKISESIDSMKSSSSGHGLFTKTDEYSEQQGDGFFGKIANAEENNFFDEVDNTQEFSKAEDKIDQFEEEVILEIEMCGKFQCYSGEQFIEIYNKFERDSNLNKIKKQIYDNIEVDSYIRNLAELRYYKERIFANDEDIINYMHMKTRTEVKESYVAMRNEMKKQNISLHFVSGYRDAEHQNRIFLSKLGELDFLEIPSGLYDEKINKVLIRSAIPGYSKHHSGYAVDFGCGNDFLVYTFASTECYDWMSENNFENSKRFGFIPSYPENVEKQGPNPEPWEFVWVGVENIK